MLNSRIFWTKNIRELRNIQLHAHGWLYLRDWNNILFHNYRRNDHRVFYLSRLTLISYLLHDNKFREDVFNSYYLRLKWRYLCFLLCYILFLSYNRNNSKIIINPIYRKNPIIKISVSCDRHFFPNSLIYQINHRINTVV